MLEMTGVTSFLSDLVGLVVWKCTIYCSWEKRHRPVWLVLDTAGVQVAKCSRFFMQATD
jgi:hypothetical protein